MSELALRLIAENKKTKATTLDLGNCGLTELPSEALECVWLEELILSGQWIEYNLENLEWELNKSHNSGEVNKITSLPSTLPCLRLLKKLVFNSNQIVDLSPLEALTNLQKLACHSNQIVDLSPLAALANLQILYCHNNQIVDLSPLSALINLQILACNSNQVVDLSPLSALTKLQSLYCYSSQIADLSPLSALTNLQKLSCSSNQIVDLSPLSALTNLQNLYCNSNQIADLSPLKALTNLQILYCHSNQIADLSPLKALTNLQELCCYSNQIADLSPLSTFSNLQNLYCNSNQIADLSPLSTLTKLQKLYFFSNQIADLSPLSALTNLQELWCDFNQITDLSPLSTLINLQKLFCHYNQISDLSPLSALTNLQKISCYDNPITDLSPILFLIKSGIPLKWQSFDEHYNEDKTNYDKRPAILVKNCPLDKSLIAAIKRGQEAVLKYFNKPKTRLFETRVLVLGEPRAGKTTLRRKLKNVNAEMPKITESTKAFEIEVEPYKCSINKDGEINKMTYHLWDFGGQDYYRLLHQLFVAEQSVYLIVTGTDANKHEEELDFWLETIQRLGKDKQGKYGPVILLQNPKNQRNDINFTELKKRYPFWQQPEQFVINLNAIGKDKFSDEIKHFDKSELERFQHFKKYLEKSFCQIEHIGKEMPTEWIRIKRELDKKKGKNLISKEEFRVACAQKGMDKPAEQDDLLAIFRTLGFLFHYESKALEGLIILDSEWITDALYRVLDDKIVGENKGWFVEADVKTIWHETKYRDRTQALLALMQEFKLSYFNAGSHKFIVPAKLPQDTEGLPEWDESANVHLRLQYDWLPRAIATQLIVTLHEHIVPLENGDQWIWRKGAVLDGRALELKNVQVRIQDFWKENRIDITARGESSELLIRTVMQKWKEVNAPFEDKVVVTKIILCNCKTCQNAQESRKFSYEYDDVLNARELGKSLRCNKSYEDFAASDILKGVFDDSTVVLDVFRKKHGKGDSVLMDLIAAGDMDKAVEFLPLNAWGASLKARYANLIKNYSKNLLSYGKFSREQSKIVSDMLTYLNSNMTLKLGLLDEEGNLRMQEDDRFGNTIIHNYGQMNISKDRINNIAYSQQMGISKADFEALQQLLQQLSEDQNSALKTEISAIELPKNETEKLSAGRRIFNWLNENAEGVVVEVVASAYYDVVKGMLGI